MRLAFVALISSSLVAACTDPGVDDPTDDGDFDIGKADGSGCLPGVDSDDARGLLAYANDPAVSADELRTRGLWAKAAANLVAARPFESVAELDAVPNIGPVACRVLRTHACDVRGLCEPELPVWTWNIKTFPLSGSTIDRVAETLDGAEIVGFQEVDSIPAFDQLVAKLPGWAGIAGEYGFGTQVALAFRTERLTLVASEDLWPNDPDHFPRPVLAVTFDIAGRVGTSRFTVVDVHLKAQVDADSLRRRREAVAILEPWLAARRAAGERVLVLGDWNDDIDDAPDSNVFLPILNKPDAYVTPTLAIDQAGGYSYIPFKRMLDHLVLTHEAAAMLQPVKVAPVPLETTISDYLHTVSDHRPVRATLLPVLPAE
jgi:endonuclease/exonuclease/phosphatase family metal-dependent hydrolase